MVVMIPDNLNPAYASNATIYITGGHNDDNGNTGVPDQDDDDLMIISTLATGVGMPMGVLFQVRVFLTLYHSHVWF